MVNQYSSSCSCMCSYYPMQEEASGCETLPSANLDGLLHIIEQNKHHRYGTLELDIDRKSPIINDANCILRHTKWSLKICSEFTSIVNQSLTSFANKLDEINCGSVDEKRSFFDQISRFISTEPFKSIQRLIISFVIQNIESKVDLYAEEEIERIISTSGNYDGLGEVILEKAKEFLCKEYNISELTLSISNEISEFHGSKFIKGELSPYFDVEAAPFATFIDLYTNHLTENYAHLISRSVEMFSNLAQDRECQLSFSFDTFLGNMVQRKYIRGMCSVFNELGSAVTLKKLLLLGRIKIYEPDLSSGIEGSYCYSGELTKFLLDSENELKEKMEEFILKNEVIVIDEGTITTCSKEFMGKITDSSVKYLRSELGKLILYAPD